MMGGNGEDDRDQERGEDAGDAAEPSGLQAVDGAPMEPLTREQVEALRRERDDFRDQVLRRRADFDNYRKRVERDRQQSSIDAYAAIFKALIPTLDNLERALAAPTGEGLREGVELIRRDLLSLLESHGVVTQDPKGEKFDPNRHQALSHEPAPGQPEGTVVEVLGKGYSYKDRLLRPAMVTVAAGGGEGGDDSGAVH